MPSRELTTNIAFVTMCLGERRKSEKSDAISLGGVPHTVRMPIVDMCTASMCSFLQHVNTSLHRTYAFVDEGTHPIVRKFYAQNGILTLSAYNSEFPRPDLLFPIDRGYAWLRLLLWNMTQHNAVLYFDSDFWFLGSPLYIFRKYPLSSNRSLMVVTNRFGWNSGLLLVRPNREQYARLLRLYVEEVILRGINVSHNCCDSEQTWLEFHRDVFDVVPGHVCDNNKWHHWECRKSLLWHYLPVHLSGKLTEWKVAVRDMTCTNQSKTISSSRP